MTLAEIRRQNLKHLIDQHGGQAAFARAASKSPVNVNQFCTGVRDLGEAVSRKFEKSLGLPLGWLDQPRASDASIAIFPSEVWSQLDPKARSLVLSVVEYARESDPPQDEAALLRAFRQCSAESRAVILSVAQAQAAQKQPGTRPNNSFKPKPLRGSA